MRGGPFQKNRWRLKLDLKKIKNNHRLIILSYIVRRAPSRDPLFFENTSFAFFCSLKK